MLEVVDTGINSFAPLASHVDVSPSEEPVFILTSGQLEAIILQAIKRATAPLIGRLENLEREVRGRGAEGGEEPTHHLPEAHKGHDLILQVVQHLQEENSALKNELEAFQEHVAQERAFDRQRIVRLESRPAPTTPMAGTKTAARIDRIRATLKARSGTVSFKELRRELGLKPNQFSALVAKLDKRMFQVLINPRARDEKALRLRAFT